MQTPHVLGYIFVSERHSTFPDTVGDREIVGRDQPDQNGDHIQPPASMISVHCVAAHPLHTGRIICDTE
jgi:hypothetical protein